MSEVRCEVCQRPKGERASLCGDCAKSYDRYAHGDAAVIGAIVWAARRARRFSGRMQDREASLVRGLVIVLEEELGRVTYRPSVLFYRAARAMLTRWLAADARARGAGVDA